MKKTQDGYMDRSSSFGVIRLGADSNGVLPANLTFQQSVHTIRFLPVWGSITM